MKVFREATFEDVSICLEIIDSNERYFDPSAKSAGEIHVRELLKGYFSEVHTELFLDGNTHLALINIQGDDVRRTYFPDIYIEPEHDLWDTCILKMESVIDAIHPDWRVLISINSKDNQAKEILNNFGYEFVRKYWVMEAAITTAPQLTYPQGVEFKKIDLNEDLPIWHQLHQNAFSSHFGFMARPFDKWCELMTSSERFDIEGTFILYRNGGPIGFVQSSNELEHEASGYISTVGVIHEEQDKGYGTLLVQRANLHAYEKGYRKIGLNVDTGNTTSALRVYERLGFVPLSSWEQFEKSSKVFL